MGVAAGLGGAAVDVSVLIVCVVCLFAYFCFSTLVLEF